MLTRGPIIGLNHVLTQQSWARQRLVPFAGQVVVFRLPPLPDLRIAIQPDGLLEAAPPEAPSDLDIGIRPTAVPLILMRHESMLRDMDITGSAELAQAVQELFRELEWDFEEDLSRLFGDVLAHRMAGAGRGLFAWQREAGLRLAQNFTEYWTEERPLIARREDLSRFSSGVDRLRDDLERMEKRLDRLERQRPR